MRFISALTAIALLLTSAVLADDPSSVWSDWGAEATVTVTSSYTNTLTVTKTLTYAFANANTNTTSTYSSQPTGWNTTTWTTHTTTATTSKQSTLTPASSSFISSETSVVPTIAPATGAASVQEINLAVAALAGAAALVWGSL